MTWLAGAAVARIAVLKFVAWAFVAGLAMGGLGTWKVLDWRAAKAEQKHQKAAFDQFRANERKGRAASADYQKESERERTRFRTIYRDVEKVVDRPVYRNVCLDADGVRIVNAAIGASAAASRSSAAMPGFRASGRWNWGRRAPVGSADSGTVQAVPAQADGAGQGLAEVSGFGHQGVAAAGRSGEKP